MTKIKLPYKYVVVGSGMVATRLMIDVLKIFGKIIYPVPIYSYATTLEKAKEIADKFVKYHDEVIIAKIVSVERGKGFNEDNLSL